MSMLCNFGENDFPHEISGQSADSIEDCDGTADFDFFIRTYEMRLRNETEFDPCAVKKVEALCDNYSIDELESTAHNLEWDLFCAKENLRMKMTESSDVPMSEDAQAKIDDAKKVLHTALVKLTVVRMAIERTELLPQLKNEESKECMS